MASLTLHNTLTGKKDVFSPMKKGQVSLYVCGITPYDEVHLGHARCYVVFDVLKRVLRHHNLNVNHIQNFTDVDDKIIERANKLGVPVEQHANKFIDEYFHWMDQLNVERADDYPLVTKNMKAIIALVERLIKNGIAYEVDGNVFYSVRQFKAYGQLSKRKIDELEAGARVDVDENKKDPLDFALWKKAKEGEPAWDSPWGKGRPGWHIECSAMSMQALGETFDIHGGGQDLIFPHHENEVAQSNGATGKPDGFARFWVHNGFVTINKQKMSKSLGNFFTIRDILAKFDPMAVRYFLLSQHYKSPLNFSDQDLAVSQTTWRDRILGVHEKIKTWSKQTKDKLSKPSLDPKEKDQAQKHFFEALSQDLNTPEALGALNQFCTWVFQLKESECAELKKSFWKKLEGEFSELLDTLGLKLPQEEKWDPAVLQLVQDREDARKAKDWKRADEIRNLLQEKGIVLEDSSTGPKLKRR